MIEKLVRKIIRRIAYPSSSGQPIRYDPTYGKIDRDIQWQVQDMNPSGIGQRCAMERTIQQRRKRA